MNKNMNKKITLKDLLFLCHAKPKNDQQAQDWKDLINGTLDIPETWETKLSSGQDKKESFVELLEAGKMGKLAIIRNMRNMQESGVDKSLVESELLRQNKKLLPFQYITSARMCPQWEDILDKSMIQSIQKHEKLKGITAVLVDVSASMDDKISQKSETIRMDAACSIAILLREICEKIDIFTFSNDLLFVPLRQGMALRDAIKHSQSHSGTHLGKALEIIKRNKDKAIEVERIIVITDEQTQDSMPKMDNDFKKCYIINIGSYENGIKNNGDWLTITGFSENVIDYIQEIEK